MQEVQNATKSKWNQSIFFSKVCITAIAAIVPSSANSQDSSSNVENGGRVAEIGLAEADRQTDNNILALTDFVDRRSIIQNISTDGVSILFPTGALGELTPAFRAKYEELADILYGSHPEVKQAFLKLMNVILDDSQISEQIGSKQLHLLSQLLETYSSASQIDNPNLADSDIVQLIINKLELEPVTVMLAMDESKNLEDFQNLQDRLEGLIVEGIWRNHSDSHSDYHYPPSTVANNYKELVEYFIDKLGKSQAVADENTNIARMNILAATVFALVHMVIYIGLSRIEPSDCA